jgi:DNA-binding Lrp family transcriptional regulator
MLSRVRKRSRSSPKLATNKRKHSSLSNNAQQTSEGKFVLHNNSRVLLDRINKNIVNELVSDPYSTSERIAKKIDVPLSTVQRRRTALERSILNKTYSLDLGQLGWRIADLLIGIDKGDPRSTAKNIIQENNENIMSASLRIGSPEINLVAKVHYRSSQELHQILQKIRALENIGRVEWSELVEEVGYDKGNSLHIT